MSDTLASPALPDGRRATLASARTHRFLLLLASVALVAIVATADADLARGIAWCTALPAYVLWIHVDLRIRGVRGFAAFLLLAISLLPVVGLLLHLVLTRGRVGVPMWLAAVGAIWVVAGLSTLLGLVLVHAANGWLA